ncbi:MAG: hypothetical protein WC602_02250 [archaeon]
MSETETTPTVKERTVRKSQAETVKFAKLMVAGMQAHATELTKRGIDEAFITGVQTNVSSLERLDAEQEALKATVKAKTAEFNVIYSEVLKTTGEAKKLIKVTIPQSGWIEFGITDKR